MVIPDPVRSPVYLADGKPVRARHTGQCPACNRMMKPGEMIVKLKIAVRRHERARHYRGMRPYSHVFHYAHAACATVPVPEDRCKHPADRRMFVSASGFDQMACADCGKII